VSVPTPLATDPRRRSVTFIIVTVVLLVLLLLVILMLRNWDARQPPPLINGHLGRGSQQRSGVLMLRR